MQQSENHAPEPPFHVQFRLRTLLYVVSAACVLLAIFQLLGPEHRLVALLYVFSLFSLGLLVFAVLLATRDSWRHIALLSICHLALGLFLLFGPILSYHVNGRAWYDYGLSGWNPPISCDEDGRTWISDYDPKFTPPATWPIIGPVMDLMCCCSMVLTFIPPTAEIVTVALPVMAIRLRNTLTLRQSICAWTVWAAGAVPTLYMVVWGRKVFEWLLD
jgi:hypothetical protein